VGPDVDGGVDQVKKTRFLTVAAVVVTVVLCAGAVGAFAARSVGDTTPPVTTSTVAASYAGDVAFDLHATDATGVSYVYYKFDKNKVNLTTVATDTVYPSVDVKVSLPQIAAVDPHPEMIQLPLGPHTVTYWAQDVEGNVEAQNVKSFTVTPAVTLASSAAVVRAGKYFTLSGTLKPAMMVGVTISAKKPGAKSYSQLTTSEANADGVFMYKMKTSLKGTWYFRAGYVNEALGLAGNSSLVKVRVR
jgi:hypothetical protein